MVTADCLVPSISIIVPTFKEAENLPVLVSQVAAAMNSAGGTGRGGWTWELIVVDDNSPDATKHVLDQLSARYPQLRYLIRTKERGLSSAVLAGFGMAVHEYVVVMDADLSHSPELIPALVQSLLLQEADFVIGSRYVEGGKTEQWSRMRSVKSGIATLLAKPLVGAVKDPMSGFFAFPRQMLGRVDAAAGLNPIGYKIALELLSKMQLSPNRIVEVPITFRNRLHGQSKLTLQEQFHYLEHLSRLYDYQYPKGSPRVKYLIAAGCGAVGAFATLGMLDRAGIAPFVSLAAATLAMIVITLAIFVRYVHAQRDFTVMKHPYAEFANISLAEFICGWAFAVSTHAELYVQMAVGLLILLLVRYTLRKVFLHDLRGIRGTLRESGRVRITLAGAGGTHTPAASA